MLSIKNLHATVGDKAILKGIDLEVKAGEVHAIMGPNGSGKSTLASVLAGHDAFTVTEGSISYQNEDLLELEAEERAQKGVFLSFQYPVEIPGVTNAYFLRTAVNSVRKARGQGELKAGEFLKAAKEQMKLLEMKTSFLNRSLNEGFSGGEKKRNEIFQMAMLDPKLCILDETDSGLDIDALKTVAMGVNSVKDETKGVVVITHYQRLLNYIVPDFTHVLMDGRIVRSGGQELIEKLEAEGYSWIEKSLKKSA